ncbi:HAD-IIIC family phosphatase [Treponema socranskii]|uniref:HAD-IIIC family phosphatase n=1 Tax=Treponema socranskii TaxID=53419 RepID=UPI003D6FE18B
MRKYFVFRNNTIEFFFNQNESSFSGYDDISVVPIDTEKYIWFYQPPYGMIDEHSVEIVKSFTQKFDLVYNRIPKEKEILVFTLCDICSTKIASGDFGFNEAISDFNTHVINLEKDHKNIKIIDFAEFAGRYKKSEMIDWKYYFTSQLAFSPKLAGDFKKWFRQKENQIVLKRKKGVVLDLDNTLWGGVLGEDGVEGIKIGGDYPGKAFLYFQKALLALSESGVILTVCSKNNESDVKECWAKNPYNIINEKYISSYRINWTNKADNIKQIASELNIGLDTFVFVDDNPAERELVKQILPMVEVPDFPEQPYNLPLFVDELTEKYFKVYALTDEDKKKNEEYKANAKRSKEQLKFTDMDSFIRSLEIKMIIQAANKMNVSRIAQMTQKTNQFNMTTRRYSESDLNTMISNGAKIWCLSVADKFGDSGITGTIIVKNREIDEFLLSCRILGKGIEKEFLAQILEKLKRADVIELQAVYIPTSKNTQVKEFYENNGFTLVVEESDGTKKYSIDLSTYNAKFDDKYEVAFLEE